MHRDMKTLRIHIESRGIPGATRILRFQRFPVLIGRHASSDCRLDLSFVSRTHARLELQGERLVLRDEASGIGTRVLDGARLLRPMEFVDLAEFDNEFQIGFLRLRAVLEEAGHQERAADENEDTEPLSAADMALAADSVVPIESEGSALESALRAALETHRRANLALEALLSQIRSGAPAHCLKVAREIVDRYPAWNAESALRLFVEQSGLHTEIARPEAAAFHALHELLTFHVPRAPSLADVGAVNAFVERLDAALLVLLEGVAALHFAYQAETDAEPPSGSQQREELAAKLLDWTADRVELSRLSGLIAEMIAHHRQLVTETSASLDRILALLHPSAIEEACGSPWRYNPIRYRVLWHEFLRRFQVVQRDRPLALGRRFASVAEALGVATERSPPDPSDRRVAGAALRWQP